MSRLRSTIPLLLVVAVQAPLAAQPTTTAAARNVPTHPAEVALMDEGEKGTVYRRFPTGHRLYTFDLDSAGRSNCNTGCESAWPPVRAPDDAVATGDWTIVVRSDGTRQWALKGRPVYMRFHDAPDKPDGDGVGGVWHVLPYTRAPINPVAATAPQR